MKTTRLPYELEGQLRKDLRSVSAKLDEILLGGKSNFAITVPAYTRPEVDQSQVLPKSDRHGLLQHYMTVRTILEYIFEHNGMIKEKYRERLHAIRAPAYLITLLENSVDVDRDGQTVH